MSLTGMKKHVRLLEEANLVATEKVGRARRCALVPYAFEGISTWLQRLDRFAQVVERTKEHDEHHRHHPERARDPRRADLRRHRARTSTPSGRIRS